MANVPFNPAEIENPVEITGFKGAKYRRFKTPITPKENYRLVYEHKMPAWIPITGDVLSLIPRIDPDNVARCFVCEANPLKPEEKVGGLDKFGVEWVYVPEVGGSMVKPGHPILDDVNNWKTIIKFPDINTWDWEGSKAANADYVNTDRFISMTIMTGFFERLISFMDFENAIMALIDEDQKDAVHELFDALADLYIAMIDKYVDCYHLDALTLHDDWGSQRAPFFSLNTAREMIVPHIKKVSDFCHSKGVFFDLHSCGKNDLVVPGYIEAGVDSWTGQTLNDKENLYELYGDKIILGIEPDVRFFGNKDVTPEMAKGAAERFVAKYAKGFPYKPVLASGLGAPADYVQTLYAESRKAFYDMENNK